jgi:hypothetical protein
LREVVCPVLKLREEKWTFVMVGGGKIDFFHKSAKKQQNTLSTLECLNIRDYSILFSSTCIVLLRPQKNAIMRSVPVKLV